jgi:hypothetical protein
MGFLLRLVALCSLLTVSSLGAGAHAQQPIRSVAFKPFADGQDSILMEPLRYLILNTGVEIRVPLGFVTDFASTPRTIWSVLPPFGEYQLAAVVHDFLYWDQSCTREQADALLRVAMHESKVRAVDRETIFRAVRTFGQAAWDANAKDKAEGKPRVIPVDYLSIPPLTTWRDYRKYLVDKEVRPTPAAATPAPYCTAGMGIVLPAGP